MNSALTNDDVHDITQYAVSDHLSGDKYLAHISQVAQSDMLGIN